MTTRGTTLDELYTTIGNLVESVTGRPWWRKGGIQNQPNGVYATVYLVEAPTSPTGVVEVVESVEGDYEMPWGATRLSCKIELFRGGAKGATAAYNDAIKFRNSLLLSKRFDDLWQIAGLVGEIGVIDVSTMFRADVEGRAEVRFSVNANIIFDGRLPDSDAYEMTSVDTVVKNDNEIVVEKNIGI